MSKISRQEFFDRPKIKNLPQKEKLRRWNQHRSSLRGEKKQAARGYTRNTQIRSRQTNRGMIAELALSPCAQEYLVAMHAPFSLKTPACVPDLHAVPSKKIRVKTRGVFSTGADGNGYIHLNPWQNCNDSTSAGFSLAATPTSSSFQPLFSASTGLLSEGKLPYASAQFKATTNNPGVLARTVAIGLRIRYIGAELARSGQITGLRHPDNLTLVGTTFDEAKSFSTAKTYHNKRQWIYAIWRPVRPTEYEFSQNPSWTEEHASAHPSLGFALQGTTGSSGSPGPAPFEFEIIRYVEYIGNIDNISPSHVDLNGMSHVRNSIPAKSTTQQPHKTLLKAVNMIEEHAKEILPAMGAGGLLASAARTGASSSSGGFLTGMIESLETAAGSAFNSISSFLPGMATMGEVAEAAPLLLL